MLWLPLPCHLPFVLLSVKQKKKHERQTKKKNRAWCLFGLCSTAKRMAEKKYHYDYYSFLLFSFFLFFDFSSWFIFTNILFILKNFSQVYIFPVSMIGITFLSNIIFQEPFFDFSVLMAMECCFLCNFCIECISRLFPKCRDNFSSFFIISSTENH